MKVGLVVNYITSNIDKNFTDILRNINVCADNNVNLILFPEMAITGLVNNDDPSHDFPLGIQIPSEFTNTLVKISFERKIYIGIGILEKEDNKKLYDTAILIAPDKGIILKYRRITFGWHGKNADSTVYCHGNRVKKVETPLGSFAFLICGDLFDNNVLSQIKRLKPDYLLFPFARCFDDGTYNKKRWNKEKIQYVNRVKLAGITTFMVNYLANKEFDGGSFGGAMIVSNEGKIISEMSIGKEGILYDKII